jgi:hypothetical protein
MGSRSRRATAGASSFAVSIPARNVGIEMSRRQPPVVSSAYLLAPGLALASVAALVSVFSEGTGKLWLLTARFWLGLASAPGYFWTWSRLRSGRAAKASAVLGARVSLVAALVASLSGAVLMVPAPHAATGGLRVLLRAVAPADTVDPPPRLAETGSEEITDLQQDPRGRDGADRHEFQRLRLRPAAHLRILAGLWWAPCSGVGH